MRFPSRPSRRAGGRSRLAGVLGIALLFAGSGRTRSRGCSADRIVRSSRFDRRIGAFTVPAWTTAVFVAPQGGHD